MNRSVSIGVAVAVLVLAGIAGALWWFTRPLPILTVTTWPGEYGRAQANAMFHPFSEGKRVDVRMAQYDGGLGHLKSEVGSHRYDWDVIDFELADAVEACHEGLLETIDAVDLPTAPDGTAARSDFVKHGIGRCWVGSVVFAQVIAFQPDRFGNDPPRSLADFFDLARFPGPRALHRGSAKLNLELALLADGVKPKDVYPLLETDEGVSRALRKLGTLGFSLTWWSDPDDAIRMLADGRAAMVTALNGNVFEAETQNRAVDVIWDRELYELDVFGIPKGDPRRDRALGFVRFATGAVPLSHVSEWAPYGPARRSSQPLVGRNPDTGIAMSGMLPTAPANFATAFAVDDEWWRIHGPSIASRWREWVAGR
jgi:putative spermidine/putrescine transport system substrate-binding protein